MDFFIYLPVLFFSVVLHEYAHGYIAYRHGDDTAYLMGRLTFNPLAHVDIFGTVIIPLLCVAFHTYPFGWARPVPVNYYRLRNPKDDMAKVSLAGPLSNVLLIIAGALLWKTCAAAGVGGATSAKFFYYVVSVNLVLTVFNLIPIPPLDGSKVLAALLPQELSLKYMRLERYSMLFVIILISSGLFRYIIIPVYVIAMRFIFAFVGVTNVQFL
jgi:Zn-dependent protease